MLKYRVLAYFTQSKKSVFYSDTLQQLNGNKIVANVNTNPW